MLAAVFAFAGTAQGQPPTEPQIVPLSKECQTPNVTAPPERPLPNTLKALKERKVIKILTIGASASAVQETPGGGYQGIIVAALEKAVPGLDVLIIDRGVSGELARDAALRMQTEVALTEPDLVLWQVGSNDALARIPVDQFVATLTDNVRWLKEHNVDVVLVGLHYIRRMRKDAHYQAIRAALSQVADSEKVLRIDRYQAMEMIERMREGTTPPNEFALTEAGYACIAEYIARGITSGIFVKRRRGMSPD